MISQAPHLSMQAEERIHNVILGNLDYQINSNDGNSSFVQNPQSELVLMEIAD